MHTTADGYKLDHRRQYTDGTNMVLSNLTGRNTRRASGDKKTVWFGLQYLVKKYLIKKWNKKFFQQPKAKVIAKFVRRINNYLGPNQIGTAHMEALHDLGYLPIEIWALPEGSVVGLRVPPMVIFSTHKDFSWVTNYLETIISTTIWLPCTSATTARQYKMLLKKFALETVGDDSFVQWQGHDFSMRGMAGLEAAKMSGAGHLLSFTGTDTIPAIDFCEDYYNADCEKELIGGSVSATEHAVACSRILNYVKKYEHLDITQEQKMALADIDFQRFLITELYPEGIVSSVSDSFDYWNTLCNTLPAIRSEIMARNGKFVVRPDSGIPEQIICGSAYPIPSLLDEELVKEAIDSKFPYVFEVSTGKYFETHTFIEVKDVTPQMKGSIQVLWDIFGGTDSVKGYKLLDSHIGLIYGDSITLERAQVICELLKRKGFASTNVVLGIGSYTYNYVTRDTDGYAIKATYCEVDGVGIEIFKDPKTDSGIKKSARGITAVYEDANGEFYLKDQATMDDVRNCAYVQILENGVLKKDWTLAEIRARVAAKS